MIKALRHPPLQRLWIGQMLSTIGDEIYRVGLTWLVVGMIGANAGYLSAAQAAALMVLSFVGGKWSDHWNSKKTMIYVDLIRGLIVLVPVIASFFWPPSLILLVIVALAIAALSAFFDPALQATLPQHSPDLPTLRAATGLIATTIRMARMVGPMIIGFLAGVVPIIQFFTLDALSFFASAFSVHSVKDEVSSEELTPKPVRLSIWRAIMQGFETLKTSDGMKFILWTKAITNGTWTLAYSLGFALLVQELTPNDGKTYGWVMASYGLGNFLGAVYFGSRPRTKPAQMMFVGYIWLGLGFVWVAQVTSIPWLMIAASFTGFSGTMNEVTFFDMVQARFQPQDLKRIVRLRMATDQTAVLLLTLVAPFLFQKLGVSNIIWICGGIWMLVGAYGLWRYQKRLDRPVTGT